MAGVAWCAPRRWVGSRVVDRLGFPVVGVVGGGQLARMMAPAGDRARASRSGAGPRRRRTSAALVVPGTDRRGRGPTSTRCAPSPAGCDVLTFDHEHVPTAHLRTLEAEGVVVRPGPDALEHAQDKLRHAPTAHRARRPVPALGAR